MTWRWSTPRPETTDHDALIRTLNTQLSDLATQLKGAIPLTGTGSPQSVVYAAVGTLYLRTDGGAGTTLYVKEVGGSTTNTGWSAK